MVCWLVSSSHNRWVRVYGGRERTGGHAGSL